MMQAFGWVLFGFAVWGLSIALYYLQRRFAPGMGRSAWHGMGGEETEEPNETAYQATDKESLLDEIEQLRKRVEVLEAIVTDKKYQFDQELNRD